MQPHVVSAADVKVPRIIYGTAWKKEATAELVEQALGTGFLGLDTACQPKHYHEPGVGDGLRRALQQGVKREQLFIQTKFTPIRGQDPNNIPYDERASLREQVFQSVEVSKTNLGPEPIDSLVLHSPLQRWDDLETVWRALEDVVTKGDVRQIGISNCYDLNLLKRLYQAARVKPAVVQNRLYSQTKYDFELRAFCRENNILYQSFWTLTANPHILEAPAVERIAQGVNKTPAQVFFRFLTQHDVIPLTGTTSQIHMKEDLAIFDFELEDAECRQINELGPFV